MTVENPDTGHKATETNRPHSPPPLPPNQAPPLPHAYHNEPFYSTKGRIGRIRYIAYGIILGFCFITPFMLLCLLLFSLSTMAFGFDSVINYGLMIIAFLAYMVLSGYITFVPLIRRLHDLNKSGWLSLLLFVPVLNLFFILYAMFAPGDEGVNKYGVPAEPPSTVLKILAIGLPLFYIVIYIGVLAVALMMEEPLQYEPLEDPFAEPLQLEQGQIEQRMLSNE